MPAWKNREAERRGRNRHEPHEYDEDRYTDDAEDRRRAPSRGRVRKAQEHPEMRAERLTSTATAVGRAPALGHHDDDGLDAVADELDRLLAERSDRSSRSGGRSDRKRAPKRPGARAYAPEAPVREPVYDDEPYYEEHAREDVGEALGAIDRLDHQVQDMSGRMARRPVDRYEDEYDVEPPYSADYARPRPAPVPRSREEYRPEPAPAPRQARPAPRRRSDEYFMEDRGYDQGDDAYDDYHAEPDYEESYDAPRPPRARARKEERTEASLHLYKDLGRRIDALRKPQEEAFEQVREELGSLRDAMGGLSKGTHDRVNRQNAELRRLADMVDRLRADKSSDQFAKEVRKEVADLKSIVGRTNVDGALQTLEHGYAHILQRLDELSRGAVDPRVLRGVTARLNEIEDAFSALPRSEHLLILDERIGSISERMEELLHRKSHNEIEPLRAELREVRQFVEHIDVTGLVEGIDDRMKFVSGRLDDLEVLAREQRGLDTRLSAMEQRMPEPETISRLQGRLEDIVGMMSDDRASTAQADQIGMMDNRLNDIIHRLERMERIPPVTTDKAAFSALENRLAAISDKIEVIEKKTDHPISMASQNFSVSDADKQMFTQLHDRMNALSSRLEEPRSEVTTADLDKLREEIGSMRAAVAEPQSTSVLEERINELAEAVTRGGDDLGEDRIEQIGEKVAALAVQMENATSHSGEMEKVATALERIEQGLHDTRKDVVDIAKNAAKEVLAEQPQVGGTEQATGEYDQAISGLQADLKRLLDAAEGSEERTKNTFNGVQSVLGSLTERLEDLERNKAVQVANVPMQAQAAMQPDLEPTPIDDTHEEDPQQSWKIPGHPLMREKTAQSEGGRDRKADFIAAARRAAQAASAEAERMGHSAPDAGLGLVAEDGERTKERAGWFRKVLGRGKGSKQDTPEAETAVSPEPQDNVAPVLSGDRPVEQAEEEAGTSGRRKALVYAAAAVLLAIGTLQVFKLVSSSDVSGEQVAINAEEPANPVVTLDETDVTEVAPGAVEPMMEEGAETITAPPIVAEGQQAPLGDEVSVADAPQALPAADADITPPAAEPAPDVAFAPPAGIASGFGENIPAPQGFQASAPADVMAEPQPTNLIASLPPEQIGPMALRSAAAGGNPEAAFLVGVKYTEGNGIPANLSEAARWYQIAADKGLPPAQYRLASLYEKGRGVDKDLPKAKAWYEKAASAGNAKAMHNLAVLYAEGQDGGPDFASAGYWFTQAATHGVQDSLFNLGILHAQGMGVEKDLIESYKWFAIAAERGDRDAASKRDEVANSLDQAQLAAARLAVENFKVKTPDPAANKVVTSPEWVAAPSLSTNASSTLENVVDFSGMIRDAQTKLNALGFNAGAPDGQTGPQTRSAVRAFQRSLGLPETGDIDAALIKELNGQSI
ncbi:peptidoglycan-binding domain 1 protein [Roseibium sp. TrichSKD4]|uniref:peptidoglycan-binding protein n=1 Tax=Roseibium sp. TrichSKD4 TaxID=744980 RepID=UPI0001E566A4|nr:peptidoglycan-binding protein [Roseibium sp. TrichSKD4]EFO34287.1 peptidoglycan-binding domain 1 protein [Roseibium sp. TrichSKD4]